MPPKAPRGGARGRGRPARGRGGASAEGSTEPQDVSMQDTSIIDQTGDSSMADASTAESASAEPVQIKSEPAESSTLASSSTMPPPPPPGVKRTPSVRGAKKAIIAQPRFAGRRSKAERDAAEASQTAKRAEEAQAKARAERRGGLRGGRGGTRGGFMGDFRRKDSTGATGVFGSGVVSAEFSAGRNGLSRGIGGGGGGGAAPPSGSRRRVVKSEGPNGEEVTYIEVSSSESETEPGEGPKRNIDNINLVSDDEDNGDGAATSRSTKSRGLRPIRMQRVERKERGQPSASKSGQGDAKRAMRNLEQSSADSSVQHGSIRLPPPAERPWIGVYGDDDEDANLKVEDDEDYGAAPVGEGAPVAMPTSPEDRKQRIRRQGGIDQQTEEEREEHERHLMDLDTIVHELGQTNVSDADGDAPMTEEAAAAKDDPRAYKVYLFQFPPILPSLQTNAEAVGKKSASSSPVLTRAVPVKPDPDTAPPVSEPADVKAAVPSGRVGKLRVHESGKVTLDWAGTSLAVGMGTEVDFLQQVVMARTFPDGRTERHTTGPRGRARSPTAEEREARSDIRQPPGVVGGEVMALGQLRGKFVVTPNWDEII